MKKKLFFLLVSMLVFNFSHGQSKDEMLVRDAMKDQQKAWNAGDIDRYMQTYWQSDSLVFIGKTG